MKRKVIGRIVVELDSNNNPIQYVAEYAGKHADQGGVGIGWGNLGVSTLNGAIDLLKSGLSDFDEVLEYITKKEN